MSFLMKPIDELKKRKKPLLTQRIGVDRIAKWFYRAISKSSVFVCILVTIVIVMIVGLTTLKPKIQDFPKIIYYMRHFQAKHNIDGKYLQVLDPDLTEYGFQQGLHMTFDNELELIICSPLSRTIQTYLSLFHDIEKRQRIPFMLDADLQEVGDIPADTARSKAQLKQKFPQLSSIIDRDLADDFNDKQNPLYSSSSDSVKQRVIRFHRRLWKQRKEKYIMIITHAGWLSRALDRNELANGEIVKKIYKTGVV